MIGAKNSFFIITLLNIITYRAICGDDVVVDTTSGKVSGMEVKSILRNEKYYSFLGIPYAEPPLGELRFMPPQPHKGWTEVLNAKTEKNACAQFYLPGRTVPQYGFYGDEDCLFLSIHTPKLPQQGETNFPVIVFTLNEQFKMSYNNSIDYAPDFFMKEDVIIVMINHRISSLGFLSFEDDLLPGNNGLRDIILSLKWVQDNIANFGGNPSSVTLMGSQEGAVSADILLHSQKAKGLFHKVILQSGTSWNSNYFPGDDRQRAIRLSEFLEVGAATSPTLVTFLNPVPAQSIVENEVRTIHADDARAYQRGIPPFGPVIEHEHSDAIITQLPEEELLNIDIPIMIGYNSRPGIELCERLLRKPQYLTFADRDFLMMFPIRTKYHFQINDNVYYEAVDRIKQFYFDEGYVKISKPGEYLTYIADIMMFYPIDYTVRKYANESKADVYYYTFDYSGELNMRKKLNLREAMNFDGTWGATIGDELCYLFVCQPIRKAYLKALKDEKSEEITVLRNMVKLWTNFAKTGNPTPKDGGIDVTWTPATSSNKECLNINEDLEMKTNLHELRVQFWDDFIDTYRKRAVDGVVKDIRDEL